jgi:hypothetical protein
MNATKIVGLKTDYGSLDLRNEDRTAFIEDALRLLREIGQALNKEGLIADFTVRQHNARPTLGYVGEIVGNYFEPQKRFAVSLVLAHNEGEVRTRPDGVAGYALYRRMNANQIDPKPKPEDRRALFGSYPDGMIHLVKTMLVDHPENPNAPKKAQQAQG